LIQQYIDTKRFLRNHKARSVEHAKTVPWSTYCALRPARPAHTNAGALPTAPRGPRGGDTALSAGSYWPAAMLYSQNTDGRCTNDRIAPLLSGSQIGSQRSPAGHLVPSKATQGPAFASAGSIQMGSARVCPRRPLANPSQWSTCDQSGALL